MDTTPNIAPQAEPKEAPAVEPKAETAPAAEPVKSCPKKKGCGVTILLLALLALAGAGTSVFFYLDNQNQAKENSKLKETISTYEASVREEPDTTDAAMIQNLLDPYLVSIGTYYSVFETGLTEDTKATIAALGVNFKSIGTQKNPETNFEDYTIYYPYVNSEYKRLFGSDKELAEKSFTGNKLNQLQYDDSANMFVISSAGYGGTGAYTVNKIKDFSISPDEITVEIYHDNVPFCDLGTDMVAEVEVENNGYCVDYLNENAVGDFLRDHEEEMPVYTLKFEKDNGYEDYEFTSGRFVLKSLEKTSDRVEE